MSRSALLSNILTLLVLMIAPSRATHGQSAISALNQHRPVYGADLSRRTAAPPGARWTQSIWIRASMPGGSQIAQRRRVCGFCTAAL